jgi:hypothetical protein
MDELLSGLSLRPTIRKMNQNPNWPPARQLLRPADDEILRFPIEISLAEREWVESMKELSDIFDSELNDVFRPFIRHGRRQAQSRFGILALHQAQTGCAR